MAPDNDDKIKLEIGCSVLLIVAKKMCRLVSREVLVILCVVVSAVSGEERKSAAGCEVTVQDGNSLTLNCSRRNLDEVPEWPQAITDVNKDAHVLITFFNNSITTISQLDPVTGTRIALSFKDNELVEIEDEAFSNIDRLVYLDLSSNRICGDVLTSGIFHGPYKNGTYYPIALETLNLGDNEIHSLHRNLFQYTPNLTRLYLNNNPLEVLDLVSTLAISSATNLKVLDLSNTEIDYIPMDTFRGLLNLEHVDLSDNKFVTVPESLSLVGNTLKYLTFNNNPIVELNDDSFVGLSSLIELEVGENEYLEEVKRSTFTPLKNLKVLHLCHNEKLRYISHHAFRGIKDNWTLKEVYLNDNDLSELSTDLMPWDKLDIIGMTGNKWLCNCDLASIVAKQGAGAKFKPHEIPYCESPMKMRGLYITNISLSNCHTIGYSEKHGFTLASLKPKHVLWSIFGVGMIVLIGMLIGLAVNGIKNIYHTKIRSQPIRYVHLNADSTFSLA